ncbi:unnamed protein product [Effrenium voratum]|uniref:Uncharacterized protein n=1 Tax=Effrenium voratum TaxID=2562239 RepID=A0AA36MNF8_9DINO|nr:unnamed protein product [Effrenium voratum]
MNHLSRASGPPGQSETERRSASEAAGGHGRDQAKLASQKPGPQLRSKAHLSQGFSTKGPLTLSITKMRCTKRCVSVRVWARVCLYAQLELSFVETNAANEAADLYCGPKMRHSAHNRGRSVARLCQCHAFRCAAAPPHSARQTAGR